MKLIDLLVKELPRRGGWPEAANYVVQDYDGTVKFSKSIDFLHIKAGEWCSNENGDDWIYGDRPFEGNFIHHTIAHDRNSSIITRAQYEVALAASDGWIEWHGGECQVDSDAIVEVKFRNANQYQFNSGRAGDFYWSHEGFGCDIIAYRMQQHGIDSRANDDRLEHDLNECIGQDIDVVNHPSHYTKGRIECIDAIDSATVGKTGIEAVAVANVIKYLWRYEEKGGIESVRKAQWYLNRLIEELSADVQNKTRG